MGRGVVDGGWGRVVRARVGGWGDPLADEEGVMSGYWLLTINMVLLVTVPLLYQPLEFIPRSFAHYIHYQSVHVRTSYD